MFGKEISNNVQRPKNQGGQQPECKGGGLTQRSENQIPQVVLLQDRTNNLDKSLSINFFFFYWI
jgi:hypothetical protein